MSTLAKIVPKPKGDYSASTTYNSLDIVRHNGKSWICKVDNTVGVTPTSGATWDIVAQDGAGASQLNELTDVSVSSPSSGQILLYNSTNGKWENNNYSQTSSLNDLTDVTLSTPSNGQVMTYNSSTSKWVNSTPSSGVDSLSELSDVAVSSISNGQYLSYNSSTGKWKNVNAPSSSLSRSPIFIGTVNTTRSVNIPAGTYKAGQIVCTNTFLHNIYLTSAASVPTADYTFGHDYSIALYEHYLTSHLWHEGHQYTNFRTVILSSSSHSNYLSDEHRLCQVQFILAEICVNDTTLANALSGSYVSDIYHYFYRDLSILQS